MIIGSNKKSRFVPWPRSQLSETFFIHIDPRVSKTEDEKKNEAPTN